MMAYFISLAGNFKTAKIILRVAPSYIFVADKASKSRAANGLAEGFQFLARAFGDEFDATVGQIADGAGDFKAGGDGFGGVAKARRPARGLNKKSSGGGGW